MKKRVMNMLVKISKLPNITGIEAEAGLKKGTLSRVLSGERNLTDGHVEKLIPVLKKYGYKD